LPIRKTRRPLPSASMGSYSGPTTRAARGEPLKQAGDSSASFRTNANVSPCRRTGPTTDNDASSDWV
jgi:hypothetical protein